MSEEINHNQELDWRVELNDNVDSIPKNHVIYKQIVWFEFLGTNKSEEKNFYFSFEGTPNKEEIYEAIFSQRPDLKDYKSNIKFFGNLIQLDKAMIPEGQGIISMTINIGQNNKNDANIKEIKI